MGKSRITFLFVVLLHSSLTGIAQPAVKAVSGSEMKPVDGFNVKPISGSSLKPVSESALRLATAIEAKPVSESALTPDTSVEAKPVSESEVKRIMEVLAGDSLEGRGNFQPGLLKAARFIGHEFAKAGLVPLPGHASFFLPFRPAGGKKNEPADLLRWNNKEKNTAEYFYFHRVPGDYPDRGREELVIQKAERFDDSTFLRLDGDTTAVLVWCNQPLPRKRRLADVPFIFPAGGMKRDVLLVIADTAPSTCMLRGSDSYYESLEYNIAGMLPGKTKESVVFSSHYDHEGIIPGDREDNIMNGANDNASGTAAVITLARSMSDAAPAQRSSVFICFAGEELGLTGSRNFIETETLAGIVAMINIEMIGLPQLGQRTVFITGENDSHLPELLGGELTTNGMVVLKDPVPDKLLYERSDNFPFALKDIPAHTIMGSTDDDECYHQFCDDLSRIDMANLCAIINIIRVSVLPFVDGSIRAGKIK
ncbi:MAG: M28 family peptidase [Chitinophagaceae bacterium]|nr:MAG: M28 family peptidase [Chitinophagaceae bacterium]